MYPTRICNCPPRSSLTGSTDSECACCRAGHRDPRCPGSLEHRMLHFLVDRPILRMLVTTPMSTPVRSRGKRRTPTPKWQRN